jgi:Mn-dependent DtxR family transcriptional regulator
MSTIECTFTSKLAAIRINRLLTILKDGPLTSAQLAEKLHVCHSMTCAYLTHLRKKPRRVRITHRLENFGASPTPVYGLGSAPDAPLIKLTRAQLFQRIKADPVRYAAYLENRRQKHAAKRAAMPMTKLKARGIDRRDPPLIRQIATLIAERPHYTNAQLAVALAAKPASVGAAALKLQNEGEIRAVNGKRGDLAKWESLATPPVRPPEVPKTPHHPFSALFQTIQEGAAC